MHIHRRFIYKGDTSTPAQGTDPRVALGAQEEIPWIYVGAWGGGGGGGGGPGPAGGRAW